jgi:translocation and assembly module TamB
MTCLGGGPSAQTVVHFPQPSGAIRVVLFVKSRALKLFLIAMAFGVLALGTLPWWLGAVLRPILHANQVTFARYERTGYGRFLLHEVQFQAASVAITADRIQAPTPALWLIQRLRGSAPLLVVTDWRVERQVRPQPAPNAPTKVNSLPELQSLLQRVIPRVGYWVPQLQLSAGRVRGFGPEVTIAQASWNQAKLHVDGLRVAEQELAVSFVPSADGTVTLTAQAANGDARLQLRWSGAEVTGEATWWEQPLQLTARFPAQGWMPAEATVVAENWRLPAARVKLGAPYAWVQGGTRFAWRDQAFELSLDAKAEPAPDTKAPPFEARAAARGGLRELTLTTLHVDAPFATARLSAPVVFSLDRPLAAETASLSVQADLAKLPWLVDARGQVAGTVTVRGDTAAARQEFALTFTDVAVQDLAVRSAEARGTLAWPRLELSRFDVQLDETSALSAHGAINWQTRELIEAAGQAKFDPAWFARWLPAGSTWKTTELSATASGPLDAPQHEGSLKLTGVEHPPLHPLAVEATWRGIGSKAEVTARAVANDSSLELAGTLNPQGLLLAQLTFAPGGQAAWQLVAPAQLAWSPVWQIDDLQLRNAGSSLRLNARGGPEGFFELAATGFDSAWLADWITPAGPAWQLQTLQAAGRVADRVLVFDATLAGQLAMDPQPAQVRLTLSGDADGIRLKELSVIESGRVLTSATGRLPLRWIVAPTARLEFDETAPLELTASTDPESPLWTTLSAHTGLQLTRPTAKINLTGTPREPVGELQVEIAELGDDPDRFEYALPALDDLSLAVRFAREAVTITGFSAKLDGQAVQASGSLPMDDGRWMQLWREPAAFDWSETTAHVEIPDADLAPLARRFPRFLAAQGRLRARVELTPGGGFAGELQLTDASSRPLPPFGTLQEITADLALADRTITARSLTAKLGGEPVTVTGAVSFVPDAAPRLALILQGNNLPLVRTTGLLVRSDLDLRADTDAAGLTRIAGTVNVRDGLVLANVNLRTLLPTGPRGVTRHPPYFSVDAEPFRHWPLAVDIQAPGTMRVRTTVYQGTTSARFRLGGTLGEPRAVGELSVDQGQILFPFATFRVQQGAVRLSEADPFRAQVSLNATSQRRDYQLRLEMAGELPSPNVTLSSAPALEAEEVLLMVMTGQVPAGDGSVTAPGTQRLAMLGAYLGRDLFRGLGFGGSEDRLEITSGAHVSRQGRETYQIEYRLDDRWTLQGEYDQFDSYNAGVKWRVYTGEGKSDEKK